MINKPYTKDYFQTSQGVKFWLEKIYTWILNLRRQNLVFKYKNSGRILEIGSGKGEFIQSFSFKKWQRFVVEPHAQTKFKQIKVFKSKLEAVNLPEEYFDIIVGWHVLEHLDNPQLSLNKLYKSLKTGGVLILSTPSLDSLGYLLSGQFWFHYDSKHHVNLYNKKSLKQLLSESGFRKIIVRNLIYEYPLDLYHSLCFKYKKVIFKPFLLILSLILKPIFSFFNKSETIMATGEK